MSQELVRSSQILNPSPLDNATPTPTPPTDFPTATPAQDLPNAPDAPLADDDAELLSLLSEEDTVEPGEVEATEPDFTSPEFEKLSADFKKAMGVDLKAAYEQYTQASTQLQTMQAAIQEQAAQQSLAQLSSTWGVTGPELDKRVAKVLALTEKMSPEQRAKYDSVEGIQTLWSKIAGSKAKAPGSTGQKSGSTSSANSTPTYKASELRDMMMKNPQLYNSQQALIEAAMREGRYVDDL